MADEMTINWETRKFRAFTHEMVKEMEDEQAEKALKKTAIDLLKRVIRKTPVDTGRARGGWLAFLEEENVAVNVSQDAGGNFSQEEVQRGIEEGDFEVDFRGASKRIQIMNGVEYIIPLEFGHSEQSPAGMLRIAMREMRTKGELTDEMRQAMTSALVQANLTARRKSRIPGSRGRLPG